jgi:putative membrane protein
MKSILKDVTVAVKGFAMGAANVVPGVSGGTLALLTGIFNEIIDSLNAIVDLSSWKLLFHGQFRQWWSFIHGRFLSVLLIGVMVSILSLAKVVTYTLVYYPIQTWAFFFGLIIASTLYMYADIKGWSWKDTFWTILGIILGIVICTLSPTQTTNALWFIFVCGAVAICTMILPGISGSFILVVLGKYDYIMKALDELNLPVLIVFAIGAILGILAFSKFLHWLLSRYERPTLLVLLGFVVGSLVKVWPWNDPATIIKGQSMLGKGWSTVFSDGNSSILTSAVDLHIPSAIIWCAIGIAIVIVLEVLSKKTSSSKK